MAAAIYNILLNRGETCIRQFTYTDIDGSPVNISDYQIHMTVRDSKDFSAPALLDIYGGPSSYPNPFSLNPIPNLTIWGIAGLITLYLSGNLSLYLPWDYANYDLFLISPTDIRTKLLTGAIDILSSITHT